MSKIIILAGFGELDEPTEADIREIATRHDVKFYPTYYDWELKGTPKAVEAVTEEYWGMRSDEWSDNGLVVDND